VAAARVGGTGLGTIGISVPRRSLLPSGLAAANARVEGHLPMPGSLVVPYSGGQPWRVEAVHQGGATLADMSGTCVAAPLASLAGPGADRWCCHIGGGELGHVIVGAASGTRGHCFTAAGERRTPRGVRAAAECRDDSAGLPR